MFSARTTTVAFADSAAATFSDSYPFSFSCSDKDNAACVAAAGAFLASLMATVLAAPAPAGVIHYHQPFSFSSNDCAACVFRSSNLLRLNKWQHQLQLSTSGFDNNDDNGVARRHSLGLVPVRQYPAQATRDIRLVSAAKTPASAEAACLRQPALQHQQHGGNVNFGGRHQHQQRSRVPALQRFHQQQCQRAA